MAEIGVAGERWREHLEPYRVLDAPLFGDAFLERWGSETWEPSEADRKAASALHTQIVSRITVQQLAYREGVESAALESIYRLFERTREITDGHFGCRHFEILAWEILNTHVRPFTAKWHRLTQQGLLSALDATDEFRAELGALQPKLAVFDEVLVEIRDGRRPPRSQPDDPAKVAILTEMGRPLTWGISNSGGLNPSIAQRLDEAEQAAIKTRRHNYRTEDTSHAVGLSLSGGGIRSATFSLGVLIALARRNILPQIDYLSTVSGGGYLGAFLLAFLATPEHKIASAASEKRAGEADRDYRDPNGVTPDPVGLRSDQLPFRRTDGEAEALRFIRHNSRYLSAGSLWNRAEIVFAQLYGLFLNFLAVAFVAATLALAEHLTRRLPLESTDSTFVGLLALIAAAAIVPLVLAKWPAFREKADTFLATLGLLVVALLIWQVLGSLHDLHKFYSARLQDVDIAGLALALCVLVAISVNVTLLSRRYRGLKLVLIAASAFAVPLLFLGIELTVYSWLEGRSFRLPLIGVGLPREIALAVVIGVLFGLLWHYVDVNFTSPLRHYRNKLAAAFLIQPAGPPGSVRPFDTSVRLLLSATLERGRSPYPLINCALNVPNSKNSAMQGRLTDFFLFSPRFCGSPLINYMRTEDWEAMDPNLDLGTAMAISAAAAAPQMGIGTMRHLSFWLALLNVRLGYWARPPKARAGSRDEDRPGPEFLLREMFGLIDERSRFVNVTDGGHIENLGVYELLRRRCKFIIAVDGEHDPAMTFHALTNLQRMAAIDLGVRLDLDLDDLRLGAKGVSRSHFRFCRIHYRPLPDAVDLPIGYLMYVKLSLTGNEGEFIRRYKMDEPDFPHHSTADQFFTEAQFEAYRSLGEHIGEKLFLRAIIGALAERTDINVSEWFTKIGASMLEPLQAV